MGSYPFVISLLLSVAVTIVTIAVFYFLIKTAVQQGVRDANRERNSGNDFEIKQTKILAEIARTNGVEEAKIQEILQENS